MFLQRSYSAPVRVFDSTVVSAVAVRAEITFVGSRLDVVLVALRADVLRVFFLSFVVVSRVTVFVAVRDVVVAVREFSVVVRGFVVRTTLVAVRDCVVSLSGFVREMAVPSRTAALAKPTQTSKFVIKTRILFISGVKFSKNIKNYASE